MRVSLTVEQFIVNAKKAELTDPQNAIIGRLTEGYRMGLMNEHYKSGGQIVWVYDKKPYYAGHVYRALQRIYFKLKIDHVEGLFVEDFSPKIGRV